jgi:hypothetical protein
MIMAGVAKAVQRVGGGYLKLFAGNATHVWIRGDAGRGYRIMGDGAEVAELSPEFLDAMVTVGETDQGLAVDLSPKMPTPEDDPAIYDSFDHPWKPDDWVNPVRATGRIL